MTFDQTAALAVLVVVVAALIWGRVRSDVVALAGAAALLGLGVVRPVEAQSAFASPALIALASLFVIAYALELSGVLDALIALAIRLCRRLGALGIWLVIGICGGASAFLNNTPIVVLAAPVVRDVANAQGLSPRRFLIPLSYVTILGGACTLIGTSTNLLVNDMARSAGQPGFGLFDITPVALVVALAGGAYLLLAAPRLLKGSGPSSEDEQSRDALAEASHAQTGSVGDPTLFAQPRPLDLRKGLISLVVFVTVVVVAALGYAPIAAAAFTGAVGLILMRVISADEAYRGLRPEILLLIAGMVVVGLSLEVSGLASAATNGLITAVQGLHPLVALALLYGVTLFATEVLSNAAVAVLATPLAVALAESLGVSPQPFLIAIMLAASAAFATPFGYQTNVLVYEMGRYSYLDFLRVGLPLNLITWGAGMLAIPAFFPF
ncbi:SLC13 family permease [Phenylobacterium kunshanense]|uniref:SLC13/DASS family transporter n=1 Tax=Phenylobacterium kunshanense TaxID=1445034 RepID=A0A328BAB6_9CAUL|nr:SLC13 family permease [Phenylobacterium kunshanense]RAK64400.1 SLC13/DASS family transporter [Phenylobacterium kunshanense]